MASVEENQLLTQVGPGTPCGELLRRYWQPACYVGDLTEAEPARAVMIMGEELVIFRLATFEPVGSGRLCVSRRRYHRCRGMESPEKRNAA